MANVVLLYHFSFSPELDPWQEQGQENEPALKNTHCYSSVQHFEHCREGSCSGIITKKTCKGKRWRRFVLFIIMCPELWNPITTLDLLKLCMWGSRGRRCTGEMTNTLCRNPDWADRRDCCSTGPVIAREDWSQGVGVRNNMANCPAL